MSEKIEGTLVLDGLLEGPEPEDADARRRVRDAADSARGRGLEFTLQFERGSFSLLADNQPVDAAALGADPSAAIRQAIDDVLRALPRTDRARAVSSLRSVEYRPGAEVQALYVVDSEGAVHVRRREVQAETTPPPEPMPRSRKIRLAVVGGAAAVLVLGAVAVVLYATGLLGNFAQRVLPFDTGRLAVDAPAFDAYLTVEGKEVSRGGRAVKLTLRRKEGYPLSVADCERLLASEPAPSLERRLAIEAMARGYVHAELFRDDGLHLGVLPLRVAGLRDKETVALEVPLPADHRLARVVLTY